MAFDLVDWHRRVKQLFQASRGYQRYSQSAPYNGRLIPLCTPVPSDVQFLVIGTNHSEFDPSDPANGENIASAYSTDVPTVNTFLQHRHNFSLGLRRVIGQSGLAIDSKWVGTNRCPIQTGPIGIDAFKRAPWFLEIEPKMDRLLRELISALTPKYVLLFGRYACGLFFDSSKSLDELSARTVSTAKGTTTIVPLWHPSWATFDARTVSRLAQHVTPSFTR